MRQPPGRGSLDVLDLIKRRRSIPKFTSDPVPREVIEEMLEAAVWAPNHHLTEPWEFFVLEGGAKARFAHVRRAFRLTIFPDPTAPEALKAADKIARDTADTPIIIVVTTRVSPDPEVAEDDYAATMIAVQNMMLTAAGRGVGTYMRTGGFIRDPGLRAFLDLPQDRRVAAVLYVGYPALVPERRRKHWQEKTRWMSTLTAEAVPAGADPPAPEERASAHADVAIDPVCHMEVEIATAPARSTYNGTTYYFCSPGCKVDFDADPARYLT